MRGKRLVSFLLLALLVLPTSALADVAVPGVKPPRNEQSEAFVALYASELVAWDSSYAHALRDVGAIVLWRYPGSGEVTGVIERYHPDYEMDLSPCYVDDEGRYWGYMSYIVGYKQNWVCLSDPTNEAIPADSEIVAAVNRKVPLMLLRENVPAILLVGGIVAATGALLYVFWFKEKRKRT